MKNPDYPGEGVNIYTAYNGAYQHVDVLDSGTYNNPADNYAWFFNYNWFHKKWNWKDDGSHSFKKRLVERDDDPIADDDTGGAVPEANLDLSQDTVPINCHLEGTDEHGSPMATCDYVGEDYNDFLVDVKLPFKSAGNCDLS